MRKIASLSMIALLAASALLTSCSKDEKITSDKIQEYNNSGEVSGTWEKNSVHYVDGNIVVPKGESLTIQEGVKVIVKGDGTQGNSPELTVAGNLYCMGTAAAPITFTVEDNKQGIENAFKGYWGGIQCTQDAQEVVLLYTDVEYTGAPAEAGSPAVAADIYAEGDPRFGFMYGNTDGKLVMEHCTIKYSVDDAMRVLGGHILLAYNKYIYNGSTGGEAINIKSGTTGDMAYNFVYGCATNGYKWSNSGGFSPQTDMNVYNNTVINSGWRRTKAGRGGSINIEKGGRGMIYNNIIVNCKYGARVVGDDPQNPGDGADIANTFLGYSWYYGDDQGIVDEFYPSAGVITQGDKETDKDVVGGVGANDPMFSGYDVSTFNSATATDPAQISEMPDISNFKLKNSSPALSGGKTSFSPKNNSPIVVNGQSYSSPAPSPFYGCFGSN